MGRSRKGRLPNLQIDWMVKGLDACKPTDGSSTFSDKSSPEADSDMERSAQVLKQGIPAAHETSEEVKSKNKSKSKSITFKNLSWKEQRRSRGYSSRNNAPHVHDPEPSSVNNAPELKETEEKAASSSGNDTHLEKIDSFNGKDVVFQDALESGSGENEFSIGRSVLKRLRDLASAVDVPEYSQSQLDLDNQEQEDEAVALQSIYGEDFVILEREVGEPRIYLMSIYVEHPETINVMINLSLESPDGSCSKTSASSDRSVPDKLHACTLQYLPPIQLICALPKFYPSQAHPYFALQARWLSHLMLSSLCESLDNLLEEQAGQVVLYSWAEWLRSSTLSYLGISDELELSSSQGALISQQESRAISTFTSPDIDIPWLMRYNEERRNEEFCSTLQHCCICFSEYPGNNFVRLPCKHFFCYQCMREYSSVHVKEGTVNSLNCPDTSCRVAIPPPLLKQLLNEQDFQRWEDLLLQKTLDSMVDVVYCPRCETICIEEEDHHVLCGRCFFSFCGLCRAPWHVGQECLSAESRLRILQERQKGSKAGEEQRRKEQDLVNELLNLKYVQKEAKQCPACKIAIAKSEGCNKMICGNCGQYFCYRCNKAIDGYEHFREGCILFDQEEIQNWERLMNDRQREVQARVELFPQRAKPCPNCGQPNIKDGNNNHIFCWSCQKHYCALCRKLVRRSSEHYGSGPNKCKQHSAE